MYKGKIKQFKKKGRRLKKRIRLDAIRLLFKKRFDERESIILTSSPRSGSTLLGNILKAIPNSCFLFEPLNLKMVPDVPECFSWRTYVPPDQAWKTGEMFLQKTFRGEILNNWTLKETRFLEAVKAKRLIVKFVRATRLLPWICQNMEVKPPIFLIRHPCAVVASQLNYGWANATRPGETPFIQNYGPFKIALEKTSSVEEYLAAHWALDQLPVLLSKKPHPWITITYEDLILRPEETIAYLFGKLSLGINKEYALSQLQRPSSMVSKSGISGVSGWQKRLSARQIDTILKTVHSFGITFYNHQIEADRSLLYGNKLPELIHQAGTKSGKSACHQIKEDEVQNSHTSNIAV